MLTNSAQSAIGLLTSTITVFMLLFVGFACLGMVLARKLGGRSPEKRQAIFSVTSLLGLMLAAFVSH